MGIKIRTIDGYIGDILTKLKAPNLASAVYISLQRCILSSNPDIEERMPDLRKRYKSLTEAEERVLSAINDCLLRGELTSSESVASKLRRSPRTIEFHRSAIYKKLGVSNPVQLAIVAYYFYR